MTQYVPSVVYRNIMNFIAYRGLKAHEQSFPENDLYKFLSIDGYVTIKGSGTVRGKTINTMVILFAPNSKYVLKSPEFKKLIISLNKEWPANNFIAVSEFTPSNHIKRVVHELRDNIFIEIHTYNLFIMEIPKHELVPKHEFATQTEINELTNVYYRNKESFPEIRITDPIIVWLGANVGDVIKITRFSENAGTAVVYRLVTK